jgi:sugar phosphate isomerase/epimerase
VPGGDRVANFLLLSTTRLRLEKKMLKNFAPAALGINGRQSELIELALTYGFNAMDVDLHEMLRRSQRTTTEDATKYLNAATDLKVGGFNAGVDLDADEDSFIAQVGTLNPIADLAKQLGARCAYVKIPAATDRLPFQEYFDVQRGRLNDIAEVLAGRDIQLAIGFSAGKELAEGKQFPFIRDVEGFLALVNSVSGSNAGFLVDTWDWVVGSGAMDQLSELSVDKIIAVRLGSVSDDSDLAKAKSGERILPQKTGLINHVKLITHLHSIGFDGPVSPTAAGRAYRGQTRESIVQRAQEAVDAISVAAGLEVAPLPKDLIEDIPYEPNILAT